MKRRIVRRLCRKIPSILWYLWITIALICVGVLLVYGYMTMWNLVSPLLGLGQITFGTMAILICLTFPLSIFIGKCIRT